MQTKKLFLLVAILLLFVLAVPALAWIEPTTVPPGNNIFAPLNSSAFGQSKVGGLILNLGNAAHGLIVRYGLVGIGTDNPQAKLDVVGKIRSTGLEVNSTTEGALLPRMTTVERDSISSKVEGLIIYNTTTKQLEIYSDGVWKVSGGGGDSLPKGTISFFNLSACPDGWAEKTELKGRYPLGLPSSGTLGQSVGASLINGENRTVGQHSHGVTDLGHNHPGLVAVAGQGWGGGGPSDYWIGGPLRGGVIEKTNTNISIQNSGSVVGTNAPYLQLLACEKQTEGDLSSGGNSAGNCTVCQISKMTTAERDAISNPEEGLEIFNTDTEAKNLFNGTEWTETAFTIPGLVGRWHMNEISGTTVNDSSGRGNNGTAIGTTIVDGKIGKARSFNGSSDYLSIAPTFSNWSFGTGNLTIEIWFKRNGAGNHAEEYLLSTGQGSNAWFVYHQSVAGKINIYNQSTSHACGFNWTPDNNWHHLSFVRDRNIWYIFLDGIVQIKAYDNIGSEWLGDPAGTLWFGTHSQPYLRLWNGLIDEVKIYNIARTAEQIKADYEATK